MCQLNTTHACVRTHKRTHVGSVTQLFLCHKFKLTRIENVKLRQTVTPGCLFVSDEKPWSYYNAAVPKVFNYEFLIGAK